MLVTVFYFPGTSIVSTQRQFSSNLMNDLQHLNAHKNTLEGDNISREIERVNSVTVCRKFKQWHISDGSQHQKYMHIWRKISAQVMFK